MFAYKFVSFCVKLVRFGRKLVIFCYKFVSFCVKLVRFLEALLADSHKLSLTRAAVADKWVSAKIGNFSFFTHCNFLPKPHAESLNEPLIYFTYIRARGNFGNSPFP